MTTEPLDREWVKRDDYHTFFDATWNIKARVDPWRYREETAEPDERAFMEAFFDDDGSLLHYAGEWVEAIVREKRPDPLSDVVRLYYGRKIDYACKGNYNANVFWRR